MPGGPDRRSLLILLRPTSENGTSVAAKRKSPARRPGSENGTFVAGDWNCRRNQHRNQSASPNCPVGGLSRRFSLESAPLPFSELTQSPVQPPDTTNASPILMLHNGCHACHRGLTILNSLIIATSDSPCAPTHWCARLNCQPQLNMARHPHRPVGRLHHPTFPPDAESVHPFHHRLAEWELS